MNKTAIGSILSAGLPLFLVLFLVVAPSDLLANDLDFDGIPDDLEMAGGAGITLPPGASPGDPGSQTFLPCVQAPAADCLAAGKVDLRPPGR